MKNYAQKFKLIFIPWLVIVIATTVIFTFLHWFLFIQNSFFNVDEDYLDLWGPMVLPWIPILIWLRPRFKLLDLKNKSGRGQPLFGFMMFAWMGMFGALAVAQAYIITATGKLTKLDNINNIHKIPLTKYYELGNFYIDKLQAKPKVTSEVSGKHNENFDMTIFVPCPIFYKHSSVNNQPPPIVDPNVLNNEKALIVINGIKASLKDFRALNPSNVKAVNTIKGNLAVSIYGDDGRYGVILVTTNTSSATGDTAADARSFKYDPYAYMKAVAWLALKYQKTISNNLSPDEKQEAYSQFANESQQDFNSKDLYNFIYLDKISLSSDYRNYTLAITSKKYARQNAGLIILSPVNEPFEARNGHKLAWIFGVIGIGSVVILILLLTKPLKEDAQAADLAEERVKDRTEAMSWIKGLFSTNSNLKATRLLIGINLLVFFVMVCSGLGFISFSGEDLLKWGANYRPAIQNGEYWRLFTCMFLHAGLMHILFNMYGLFIAGIFLEKVTGAKWFLILYLITGIFASLTSIWWHPATISVGASGAIFGMYGVLFALLTTSVFQAAVKKPLLISTSIFIGCNLLYGLAGGIDNAAHVGGVLSGFILGYIIYIFFKNQLGQQSELNHQEMVDELNNKDKSDVTA